MEENTPKKSENGKQIASAIVVMGLIIAGAILLKDSKPPIKAQVADNATKSQNVEIRPVTDQDHFASNQDAKIVIVEYSDTECPFCKLFQGEMHQLIAGGKIGWVYRHFPIASLHTKAFHEAVATECAWEQGGNDMFWKYTDEVYSRTNSNNSLDPAELTKIATDLGLNMISFNDCLTKEKYKDKVQADLDEGIKAGIQGTPTSFIFLNGKMVGKIEGAQPIDQVEKQLNAL
jgi:protein-disulfide isomerase